MGGTLGLPVVLVVEDNKPMLFLLKRNLEELYDVEEAEDGRVAWEKLVASPKKYVGVVLDIMMPNMDGYEVCRRMRAHTILKGVPVVFHTAKVTPNDEKIGLELGAVRYVKKTGRIDELVWELQLALEERTAQRRGGAPEEARTLLIGGAPINFRTMAEAEAYAKRMSELAEEGDLETGFLELLKNALYVTFAVPSCGAERPAWLSSQEKKPKNAGNRVTVLVTREPAGLQFVIRDMGGGFDSEPYFQFVRRERKEQPPGMGVVTALVTFEPKNVKYKQYDGGMEVRILVPK